VLAGVIQGERPDTLARIGISLALVSVWLVTRLGDTAEAGPSGARFGSIAGVGFASFFVLLDRVPDSSGLWALVPARLASLLMVTGVALLAERTLRVPRSSAGGMVAVGAGDLLGNALFLAANRIGMLSLVAAMTSLYPAVTVTLAAAVLRERVSAVQWAGVVCAVVAVPLMG
jgi:drug/metabolite transporter (DMT)-like permease